MTSVSLIVICLAYIVGLLMTAVPYGGYGVLGLGVAIAAIVSLPLPVRFRNLRNNVKPAIWLTAGVMGLVASFYLQWRTPTPAPDDISKFLSLVNPENQEQVAAPLATVSGKVLATPSLTRSEKVRLWLKPTHLQIVVAEKEINDEQNDEQNSDLDSYCSVAEEVSVEEPDTKLLKYDCQVSGKLYVTVPLLQGTGRYPGQLLTVTGQLYEPKAAANPGAFDFKAYLAKEGCFAGLAGRYITASPETGLREETRFPQPSWGLWQVRRRIVKSQTRWLGVPHGLLVSAMVLGRLAVDLGPCLGGFRISRCHNFEFGASSDQRFFRSPEVREWDNGFNCLCLSNRGVGFGLASGFYGVCGIVGAGDAAESEFFGLFAVGGFCFAADKSAVDLGFRFSVKFFGDFGFVGDIPCGDEKVGLVANSDRVFNCGSHCGHNLGIAAVALCFFPDINL